MGNTTGFVGAAAKLKRLVAENQKLALELAHTHDELLAENNALQENLVTANKKFTLHEFEREKRSAELVIASQELTFQQAEKGKRAAELAIADKELIYQQGEKNKRAAELVIADRELAYQQAEKGKRAAELIIIDSELAFEMERGKRAGELTLANKLLAAQFIEMGLRADALAIANKEKLDLMAQLSQSQKMESLGILAGGIAHDMNNVLGAILSLASAHLTTQVPASATYQAFETMRDAALRGRGMVKRLLNFARQGPNETRVMDMNSVILEQVRLLEYTTLAQVHLEMELAPALKPIQGDASALAHLFINLCVNSVEAMGEGGTLTLRSRNTPEGRVEVQVEDTGCGMSREVLDRAMVPFFTTKEVGKGTGLGLSIVYTTMKAHGGLLAIRSVLGHGTCITLDFPAAQAEVPAETPLASAPVLASSASLTVLLVDDDDLILRSTAMLVEVLGHKVVTAERGEEALARLSAGLKPDVVILDMNMPGLGGKRTLPKLRSLCPDLPVLLATGRADDEALSLIAAHPRVSLLSKPFTIEELQGELAKISPQPETQNFIP